MRSLKKLVLKLYWLPAFCRVAWRTASGRLFVYRTEPNEFLRLMLWLESNPRKRPEGDPDPHAFFAEARKEVELRKRRGDWFPEEEGQRP